MKAPPISRISAFGLARHDLLALGVIVLFQCLWSYQTTGRLGTFDPLIFAGVVLVIVVWGRIVAFAFSLAKVLPVSFPAVFLLGLAVIGPTISMAKLYSPLDIRVLFWMLGCTGLFFLLARRRQFWRLAASEAPRAGLLALFLGLAGATAWIQHYLPPTSLQDSQVIFKPIRDHFIHTEQITLLAFPGDVRNLGRYGLSGEPIPFYHYASYALPALIKTLTDASAYELNFSLWLPMGLAAMGMAAYVLGSAWFGVRGGIWCLVGVLVVPDATMWTLGLFPQGLFLYSFLRFLQIAASNAYGIAIAGMGLACVTSGIRSVRFLPVAAGISLAAISLFFKAQVFVAAFPLCLLVALFGSSARWRGALAPVLKKRKGPLLGIVMLFLGLAAILPLTPFWERIPRVALEIPPGKRLAEFLVMHTVNDSTASALALRAADTEGLIGVGLRALLVLYLPFRFLLPLFCIIAIVAIAWRRCRWIDLVAILALTIYLAYALLLAPNITGHAFGNPWDLQFVPFCWAYFLMMTWFVGRGRELFAPLLLRGHSVPLTVAVLILILPWWLGKTDTNDWQTDQLWAYMPVPRGLVDCSNFLRSRTKPDDRIQDAENDPYYLVEAAFGTAGVRRLAGRWLLYRPRSRRRDL
ncbi:MAG: hypothetical protein U1D30_10025 [Planctomycetota bacterium]